MIESNVVFTGSLQFFELVLESDQNMSDGFKWFKVTRDWEPKDSTNETVRGS